MIKYKYFILILMFPILISAQSNLKWGSPLSMDPRSPKVGQEITFRAVVTSIGGSARTVGIVGGINGEQVFSKNITKLGISQNVVIEFSWTPTAAGDQKAFLQIVPGRKRGDSNPNDNRIERTFKVESSPILGGMTFAPVRAQPVQAAVGQLKEQPRCDVPGLPQIIVANITLSHGPYPTVINEVYDVEIGLINIGQCETGDFHFQLKVREQVGYNRDEILLVGTKTVNSLKPFETATVSFEYSFSYQSSTYNFIAIPDYDNRIEEYCEYNNTVSDLYCRGGFIQYGGYSGDDISIDILP